MSSRAEATGELLVSSTLFPPAMQDTAREPTSAQLAVLHGVPGLGTSPIERFLLLSIGAARERLYITNSYFVPSPPMRRLLRDAARRGVDVRILTAGTHTDIPSARFAGRGFYEELLEAGIRIYEYRAIMMHGKTFVVDDAWGSVGSMNFDNRSMRLNDETVLVVLDRQFGEELTRIFIEDLRVSDEIALERHATRPWTDRARELFTRAVAPLL